MSKLEEVKRILENDLKGQLPLYFKDLIVFDKNAISTNEGLKNATAKRIIEVDAYQTDKLILGYGVIKPITKTINYSGHD